MSQSHIPSGAEPPHARSTEPAGSANLQRLTSAAAAINPSQGPSPPEIARKQPSAELPASWAYTTPGASNQPTPGTQPTDPQTRHPFLLPQQPSTMIGAPPMWYDPEQAIQQATPDYQQWVDLCEQHQQQQQQVQAQTALGQGIAYAGHVPQTSFQQQQRHSQAHLLQQHIPVHPLSALAAPVQPSRNQYNFVPNPYVPQPDEPLSYDERYAQTTAASRPQAGLPRRARQAQSSTSAVPFTFTGGPQSQSGELADNLAASASNYQHQHQHPSFNLHLSTSTSDFYDAVQPDLGPGPDPPPQQTYVFTQYQHPDAPAPRPSLTPSSDATHLSSLSPNSWGGTDDLSYQGDTSSQHGGTSVAGSSHARASSSPSATVQTTLRVQQNSSAKAKGRAQKRRIESEQTDDDEPRPLHINVIMPPTGTEPFPTMNRLPGACKHCKKLKMKCFFPPGENVCNRCKGTGHACIVEGRKLRNAPNKREYLLAQIRQKDAMIEKLLRELHNPYTATPFSIASYRLATSPSDRNKESVIDWLDRLESSVQHNDKGKSLEALMSESRDEDSDGDNEDAGFGDATERGSVGHHAPVDELANDAHDEALPDVAVPIDLLASLSISNSPKKDKKGVSQAEEVEEADDDNVGVANDRYFMPGPAYDLSIRASLIQNHSPPEILVHGLVTPSDVEELFKIFYNRLNVHVTLLDEKIHTPAMTFARCPFLFTVVCALASRYYEPKSEIYPIAMHFAKRAAADGLLNGWKSVELSQAYILLSTYAVPARRWEEDRSWLYMGLAIRIATDLSLHQVSNAEPKNERDAREMINKRRLWMICFNLDRSMATQFGKPATIKENFAIRNSENWYKTSRFNHPYDVGLCAYTQMLRIMARFHDEIFSDPTSPTGLNQAIDFREVTLRHDEDMMRYFEDWTRRFQEDSDLQEPAYAFRASLLPFLTNYSRLVMYSFGFQQAFKRGMQPGDQLFLDKCFQAAKAVILCMIESLSPDYMRYSPDGHFVFASFASAFLLKLMRPEFANLITNEQEAEIFDLIGRLIERLSSREIAIDERHTPKLHARFLAGLLKKHRRDVAVNTRMNPRSPEGEIPQGSNGAHQAYPSHSPPGASGPSGATSSTSQPVYQTSPAHGAYHSNQDMTANHAVPTMMMQPEQAYQDVAYALGTGPMDYGPAAIVENLGALLALQSPAYWQDMMMPGYSGSWPESPPNMGTDEFYNAPEAFNGFNNFQTAQAMHS